MLMIMRKLYVKATFRIGFHFFIYSHTSPIPHFSIKLISLNMVSNIFQKAYTHQNSKFEINLLKMNERHTICKLCYEKQEVKIAQKKNKK